MVTPHQSMLTLVLTVMVLVLPSTGIILNVKSNSTTPCDNEPGSGIGQPGIGQPAITIFMDHEYL